MLTIEKPKMYVLSPDIQDDLWRERKTWLAAFGPYGETICDDKEGEFIIQESRKVYLPKQLEKRNIFAEVDYSKPPF